MDGFALYLGLKLYRGIQGFHVGNYHLMGILFCPCRCMEKAFLAMAYWDSMGRVITQTRGRAFQTLGQAF